MQPHAITFSRNAPKYTTFWDICGYRASIAGLDGAYNIGNYGSHEGDYTCHSLSMPKRDSKLVDPRHQINHQVGKPRGPLLDSTINWRISAIYKQFGKPFLLY